MRFIGPDDAIALANGTEYGLVPTCTAAIWPGRCGSRRHWKPDGRYDRGVVSDPAAPFGGVKQSGIGREGGHEGLLESTETKYIAVDW